MRQEGIAVVWGCCARSRRVGLRLQVAPLPTTGLAAASRSRRRALNANKDSGRSRSAAARPHCNTIVSNRMGLAAPVSSAPPSPPASWHASPGWLQPVHGPTTAHAHPSRLAMPFAALWWRTCCPARRAMSGSGTQLDSAPPRATCQLSGVQGVAAACCGAPGCAWRPRQRAVCRPCGRQSGRARVQGASRAELA